MDFDDKVKWLGDEVLVRGKGAGIIVDYDFDLYIYSVDLNYGGTVECSEDAFINFIGFK